jgi:predicted metalloprotease
MNEGPAETPAQPLYARVSVALAAISVCAAIGWAIGFDPRIMIGGADILLNNAPKAVENFDKPRIGVPSDPMGLFVSRILGSTEQEWEDIFSKSGQHYRPPIVVLYRKRTRAACGLADSIMGPFYCANDQKVYLDTSFFSEIENDLRGCNGAHCQFSDAYVIAHEVGHHIQNLLGITLKVRQLELTMENRADANRLHVLFELQADCLAGVWAHHAQERLKFLGPGDIEAAMQTAAALGNDTLQQSTLGYTVPDSFTHGSAEQRQHWFGNGFKIGTVASCNTFSKAQHQQ